MNKKRKFIILAVLWAIIIFTLYKTGLLTTDLDKIMSLIAGNTLEMQLLFVLLSTIRVIFFIPQTVFILLGSMLFGPYVGFILSFVSLILSQSIMYFIGKYFNKEILGNNFQVKYKDLIDVIKTYGYRILALGIVCPVAPSDLITSSAACIGLKYIKCILVIAICDAPMIFLYGFLGSGFADSIYMKIFTLAVILIISYYSITIWNKLTKNNKKG